MRSFAQALPSRLVSRISKCRGWTIYCHFADLSSSTLLGREKSEGLMSPFAAWTAGWYEPSNGGLRWLRRA